MCPARTERLKYVNIEVGSTSKGLFIDAHTQLKKRFPW